MGDGSAELPEMNSLWQQTLSWQPDNQQQLQFQRLYELILAGSRQLNLTRITEPTEFWEKHVWDSLRGVARLSEGKKDEVGAGAISLSPHPSISRSAEPPSADARSKPSRRSSLPHLSCFKVIDIGTGAGFPGIPIAIAQPNWIVTLLDSTRKKIAFLKTLLAALGIDNVITFVDRAEQVGQDSYHRETYDIALVRAVGPASVCAEYALPLLKPGGLAVLYRGQWTGNDANALGLAVEKLGGMIESTEGFTTPISQSVRHCLYLRKVNATPIEFPRSVGLPAQQPL